MSGSGNTKVEIKITGSVDASVQASASQAAASMNSLGGAATVSGKKFADALKEAGGDLRKISPEVLGLGTTATQALEAVEEAAKPAEAATGGLRLMTAGTTREFIVLGHEVMTGNFSRIPGSLIVATERMGSLQSIIGAVASSEGLLVAASAGVVAAMGYIAYTEYEAQKNAEALAEGFAITGRGANESSEAVQGEIEQLNRMPDVTNATAEAIVSAEAAHAEWSDTVNFAANQLLPEFSRAMGDKAPEAINRLKEALSEIENGALSEAVTTFDRLNSTMLRLSPSEAEVIRRMIETGERTEAVIRISEDLARQGGGSFDSYRKTVENVKQELADAHRELDGLVAASEQGGDPTSINMIQIAAANAEARVAALEARLHQLNAQGAAPEPQRPVLPSDIQDKLQTIAQDVSKTDSQVLQSQIGYLESEQRAHNLSAEAVLTIHRTLAEKRIDLARRTSTDVIETERTSANAEGLTGAARAQAEIDADRKLLADKRITAQDKLAVERDLTSKLSTLHQEEATAAKSAATEAARDAKQAKEEELRSYQETANEARRGSEERIAADRDWYNYAVAAFGRLSSEAKSAFDAVTADTRAFADAQVKAFIDASNATIAASDRTTAERIRDFEEQYRYAQISAADETQLARDAENQRNQNAQRAYQVQIDMADGNKTVIDAINKQIEQEATRHTQRLTEIARQGFENEVQDYAAMTSRMLSLEDALVGDIFTTRQSLWADLRQEGLRFLQQEISDDLKYFTERLLMYLKFGTAMNAQEKGGVLVHLLGEQSKTAATTAGVTTRETIGATENTTFLGRVAAQIASWLGLETAKTVQSTTAAATRSAELATETAAAIAASKAQAVGEIPAYTGIASMAAAASVASIPYVGPALATAAFAEMQALGGVALGIASAEGGQYRVPFDGQLTELHRDEMVLPASFANALRETMGANFGGSTGGGAGGSTSINSHEHHWHFDGMSADRVLTDPAARRKFERYIKNAMRNAA